MMIPFGELIRVCRRGDGRRLSRVRLTLHQPVLSPSQHVIFSLRAHTDTATPLNRTHGAKVSLVQSIHDQI